MHVSLTCSKVKDEAARPYGGDLLLLALDEGLWSLSQGTVFMPERTFSIKSIAGESHKAVPVVAFGVVL